MTLGNFLEGVRVIAKYYDDPAGFHLGAEHDQIFLYAPDHKLSDDDVAYLRDLGWFQADTDEDSYDPDEGWSAYV